MSTFYSGAELDRVSARDLARYGDTAINWRVARGYGALVAGHGEGLDVALSTVVRKIDSRGKRVRVDTTAGTLDADAVVVTLPTDVLAATPDLFLPTLPEKIAAAAGLPLGLADKLYLALKGAEEFRSESRLLGRNDSVATAAYHFRPFGRPVVEAYFGGETARRLEAEGERAFVDFAVGELVNALGSDIATRLRPVAFHAWAATRSRADPIPMPSPAPPMIALAWPNRSTNASSLLARRVPPPTIRRPTAPTSPGSAPRPKS